MYLDTHTYTHTHTHTHTHLHTHTYTHMSMDLSKFSNILSGKYICFGISTLQRDIAISLDEKRHL